MPAPLFSPGFRCSALDAIILGAGIVGSLVLGSVVWWAALVLSTVVLHFFFFCNVFRISRPSELLWALGFIVLCGSTIMTGFPGWIAAMTGSVGLACFLVWRETKRDDYHGVGWQRWNPDLLEWWESRHPAEESQQRVETGGNQR